MSAVSVRLGSLQTTASELAKCNSDVMAVQEVRWSESGSQRADEYTFFRGNGNALHPLRTCFFIHKVITSAGKTTDLLAIGYHIQH